MHAVSQIWNIENAKKTQMQLFFRVGGSTFERKRERKWEGKEVSKVLMLNVMIVEKWKKSNKSFPEKTTFINITQIFGNDH